MNIALKIMVVTAAVALVTMAGETINAQGLRTEVMKGIIQTMGPDVFKSVLQSVAVDLAKDPQFRKEVIQEVVQVTGADRMENILKSTTVEAENFRAVKEKGLGDSGAGPQCQLVESALASVAHELIKDRRPANAVLSQGAGNNSQALTKLLREMTMAAGENRSHPSGEIFHSDLITIISHPSNSVHTLTMDQVRKLFSGEHTNWLQVGGTDLPVKLVTPRETPAALEGILHVNMAPSAVRAPFLSFLLVDVAQTEGALGFLPTGNMEQLEFVRGNTAVKKIAIKRDTQSPALAPSPGAVIDGSYPLLTREPK